MEKKSSKNIFPNIFATHHATSSLLQIVYKKLSDSVLLTNAISRIPFLMERVSSLPIIISALFACVNAAAIPLPADEHLRATGVEALLSLLPPSLRMALQHGAFVSAFTQSFLLILACELGDRTFFVAAILAMKSSRFIVWSGAMAALALMTVVSALIGKAFPLLFDKKVTSALAAILFAWFGLQLLRDWWRMRKEAHSENDELAEVEEELSGGAGKKSSIMKSPLLLFLSPVFVKSFSMTALAEWGDRSQIATIALAAAQNMYGVIIGAIIGHAMCTTLAVIGGRLLATRISERMVALIGGVLFVTFAVITASGKLD